MGSTFLGLERCGAGGGRQERESLGREKGGIRERAKGESGKGKLGKRGREIAALTDSPLSSAPGTADSAIRRPSPPARPAAVPTCCASRLLPAPAGARLA